MGAKRRSTITTVVKEAKKASGATTNNAAQQELLKAKAVAKIQQLKALHLAPLPLVLTVLVCSGFMWMLAFRDLMATGRPIMGRMDEAMQLFTKSTDFFQVREDGNYFKSVSGGLSAVRSVTTDENNMGGLFVRKVAGVAAIAAHSQKLMPLLFPSNDAHFGCGHFTPMLVAATIGNVALATLHMLYLDDLRSSGEFSEASSLVTICIGMLLVEALVMSIYALIGYRTGKAWLQRMGRPDKPEIDEKTGKGPNSLVQKIVTRTVLIVSGLITLVAGRDLFMPGFIMSALPADDIYLEWTGAFFHSPQPNTPEAEEHGMESAFFIGDKYVAQQAALCLLIGCLYKLITAFHIRVGLHEVGMNQAKVIWRVQSVGDGMLCFMCRIFAPAASTAQLDLRWHLMCLAYETFILALYAYL